MNKPQSSLSNKIVLLYCFPRTFVIHKIYLSGEGIHEHCILNNYPSIKSIHDMVNTSSDRAQYECYITIDLLRKSKV